MQISNRPVGWKRRWGKAPRPEARALWSVHLTVAALSPAPSEERAPRHEGPHTTELGSSPREGAWGPHTPGEPTTHLDSRGGPRCLWHASGSLLPVIGQVGPSGPVSGPAQCKLSSSPNAPCLRPLCGLWITVGWPEPKRPFLGHRNQPKVMGKEAATPNSWRVCFIHFQGMFTVCQTAQDGPEARGEFAPG